MNRERGLTVLEEMLGKREADRTRRQWKEISPELESCIVGFVAGEIWARPRLDRRTKSLCTIAALAALGRTRALELNLRIAVNNGASRADIVETFMQIAPYAGFPASWEALALAAQVLGKPEKRRKSGRTGRNKDRRLTGGGVRA